MSEKMKILLIRPPQEKGSVFHIIPPLGLGYLATAVKYLLTDVQIVDSVLENLGEDALLERIGALRPDLIGFTVYSHDLASVKRISEAVKKNILKNVTIVVGGPHPSIAPQHTFDFLKSIDFAFQGEAEEGFSKLVVHLLAGENDSKAFSNIPGMIYREASGVLRVNPRKYADELDHFGFPDWELIRPARYFKTCHGVFYKHRKFAPIFTSRGCNQTCSFCAAHGIMGRKIRRRSVQHVVREIKMLRDAYGIREFHILDDNFTAHGDYVIDFCKTLISSGAQIAWACPNGVRLDSLNEEVLDWMKRSGCYSIFVGIESGSQRVLDSMKKNLKISAIEQTLRLIKKKGLKTTGFFILGYPGETEEELRETIRFAKKLLLDVADFSNFIPLPGSEIFEEVCGMNSLYHMDMTVFSSPANIIESLSDAGLKKKMIRKAYRDFYFRPKILIPLIFRIRSIYQVYFILKRLAFYLNPQRFLIRRTNHA
jgi:radical SAM superfamily enzyme YgiQ (UPF0313 family)